MERDRNVRKTLVGIVVAQAAISVLFAVTELSPLGILAAALAVAFLGGLQTPYGVPGGVAMGGAVIVVSLLFFAEQDPSGIGSAGFWLPIQLVVWAVPMAIAAWFGRRMR